MDTFNSKPGDRTLHTPPNSTLRSDDTSSDFILQPHSNSSKLVNVRQNSDGMIDPISNKQMVEQHGKLQFIMHQG
jgi:hypothetical protein